MVDDNPDRIERLMNEIATLKVQVAEVQSLRQAEARVMEYLGTQTEPVDEDRIHDAVATRRATIQRTLRKCVDDGQVKRSGAGRKGDPYRYQIAGIPVPDMDAVPENENPKEDGSDDDETANTSTGGGTSSVNRSNGEWKMEP